MMWLLVLATAFMGLFTVPAKADGAVEIDIATLSPQLLDLSQPDQRITLAGTIRNNSDRAISSTSVHFWRSSKPLTDHEELEQTLTS